MKYDNIQDLWNEFQVMEEKQILSRKMIQEIVRSKSKSTASLVSITEWLNTVVAVILLPIFGYLIYKNPGGFAFSLTIYSGLVLAWGFIGWQAYKLILLTKIDYASDSIVSIAQKLSKFKSLLKKEMILQFFYQPVFLFTLFVALTYLIRGDNFLEDIWGTWRLIVIYVATTILTLLNYKDSFKSINKIEAELKGLEEIVNEG